LFFTTSILTIAYILSRRLLIEKRLESVLFRSVLVKQAFDMGLLYGQLLSYNG